MRWLDTNTVRPSFAKLTERLAHPEDPLRVETDGRLVEDQDRRIAEQRRGDAETLPHPEREGRQPAAEQRSESPTSSIT